MGYGRRRFERKGLGNATFGLNITSMTDMFTIMLVFLLQTFSTSDVQIIPEKDVRLPTSTVENNPVQTLKISLSKTELKVEGKLVTKLKNGYFEKSDIDPNDKNFLPAFFAELETTLKNTKFDFVKDGKILLQADSSLSYETLRRVMYTSSMAGFPKLKIATVMGDGN